MSVDGPSLATRRPQRARCRSPLPLRTATPCASLSPHPLVRQLALLAVVDGSKASEPARSSLSAGVFGELTRPLVVRASRVGRRRRARRLISFAATAAALAAATAGAFALAAAAAAAGAAAALAAERLLREEGVLNLRKVVETHHLLQFGRRLLLV